MLLILIPIAWLAIVSLLVAICRVAAEGDASSPSSSQARDELIGVRLALPPAVPHSRQRRLHGRKTLSRPAVVVAGRRRVAAHGIRFR